jgi:hypothetical protein
MAVKFVKKGLENVYDISSHHQEFAVGKVDHSHNSESDAKAKADQQ